MRFAELEIGDVFEFDRTGLPLGLANGPWVKVSARYYVHIDQPKDRIRVGTIKTKVIKLV